MAQKHDRSGQAAKLRWRAEEMAKKRAPMSHGAPAPVNLEQAQQTIHELRVHQIELEMQNEELCRVHAELETVRAHYFDLYNLAPVGYCILSPEGLILEANLTAVSLLGSALSLLIKTPITKFILKDDQDVFYLHRKQHYETGSPTPCELRMVKKDGTPFWAQLTTTPLASDQAGGDGASRLVLSDITERKRMQEENAKLLGKLQRAPRPRRAASGTPKAKV